MKLRKTPEAHNYRNLRLSVGLSATELATGLGVTRETISRREAGTMKITVEAWLALSKICEEAFQVNWSYAEAEKRHDETHDDAPKPKKEPLRVLTESKHSPTKGTRNTKPKRKKRR
jgi:predicted transcriptional regulator